MIGFIGHLHAKIILNQFLHLNTFNGYIKTVYKMDIHATMFI